jgi:hypothetical protein
MVHTKQWRKVSTPPPLRAEEEGEEGHDKGDEVENPDPRIQLRLVLGSKEWDRGCQEQDVRRYPEDERRYRGAVRRLVTLGWYRGAICILPILGDYPSRIHDSPSLKRVRRVR